MVGDNSRSVNKLATDHEETNFILDDFHRVRDPRMMTEEYFDPVAETYDELAETGPMD